MKNKVALPRIIIVGANVSTLLAAKKLGSSLKGKVEVLFINNTDNFVFKPAIFELLCEDLKTEDLSFKLPNILRGLGCDYIKDNVMSVDFKNKEVVTPQRTFRYDYLILSMVSQTLFFPGKLKKYGYEFKTLSDVELIQSKAYKAVGEVVKNDSKIIHPIVIGGSIKGVLTAFSIQKYLIKLLSKNGFSPSYAKTTLLVSDDEIIKGFTKKFRRYVYKKFDELGIVCLKDSKITSLNKSEVHLSTGYGVKYDFIINTLQRVKLPVSIDENLVLDKSLRLGGKDSAYVLSDYDECFANGDNSIPGVLYEAERQVDTILKNISGLFSNKKYDSEYVCKHHRSLFCLGNTEALVCKKHFFSHPALFFFKKRSIKRFVNSFLSKTYKQKQKNLSQEDDEKKG
ncbi:FAD-dependent oxidoreductase [Candidatus Woesearchaeota archaeon]|nr:FAD-dependent oxidoreductase [Candidatus Woesearchaeota archaeon]